MAENNELVEAGEEQEMDKVPASKSFMPSSDIMRQIIIVVALAVCLAVVVYLIFLAKAPEMRPLGQYDSDDLVKVLDLLDANKVEYELDNTRTGGTVYVAANEYQKILLIISKAGNVVGGKSSGDELIPVVALVGDVDGVGVDRERVVLLTAEPSHLPVDGRPHEKFTGVSCYCHISFSLFVEPKNKTFAAA